MSFFQDYIEGVAMRNNPALLKRKLGNMDAEALRGTIGEMYGQAATPEQTAPYQMGVDERMEGEEPIQGLMDITQQAAPGSGLIGGAGSPEEARYLEAQKILGMSGQGAGLTQQQELLKQLQGSVMGNQGSMIRNQDTMANAYRMAEARDATSRANAQRTAVAAMDRQKQKQQWELEHGAGPGDIKPVDKIKMERDLRKDYKTSNASYREQRRAMDTISNSYSISENGVYRGTGPGDVAIITGFMKMLDPRSIVRETEFAMAQDTAGLRSRLTGMLKSFKTGETLSDEARKQMVQLMDKYWDATKTHMTGRRDDAVQDAEEYELSPERVVGRDDYAQYKTSRRTPQQAQAKPPASAPAQAQAPAAVKGGFSSLPERVQAVARQMRAGGASPAQVRKYLQEQGYGR